MNRRRVAITLFLLLLLAGLAYLQFRQWRDFSWGIFFTEFRSANKLRILLGAGLVYLSYILRSIRWKLFLRPVKKTTTERMLAPQVVGFTGLAILGRPGELIRPYLIARKEGLTFSSQIAVWTVERIFDMASVALLIGLNLAFSPALRSLPYYTEFKRGGLLVFSAVMAAGFGAFALHRWGAAIGGSSSASASGSGAQGSMPMGQRIAHKIHAFREGLNTIQDFRTLVQLLATSFATWLLIAFAYREITHALPPLREFTLSHVLLLMGFSVVGSTVQLPVVGGGSQLSTIIALERVFRLPHEIAAACGILLWLTTFMSVIPLGLILAHREHVSLRKLSQESRQEQEREEAMATTP